MDLATDITLARRAQALQTLADNRRSAMRQRWPLIDFDADVWPIKTAYKVTMTDIRFGSTMRDFAAAADPSYMLALRCLAASAALDGKLKSCVGLIDAWRLLAPGVATRLPLAALRRLELTELEIKLVDSATFLTAQIRSVRLGVLSQYLDTLARHNVVDQIQWSPSVRSRGALRKLTLQRYRDLKVDKADALDRQIEAFSDATAAMLRSDSRLNSADRSAIALTNILMCAPSRINEPLCLKIGDRFTIEDYAMRGDFNARDGMHRVHQLLLMKGSKGAQWAPKPILNFMVGLVDECWKVLLDLSQKSRSLVTWYEENPNRLYLTSELEYLRDQPLTLVSVWQICNLSTREPGPIQRAGIYTSVWKPLVRPDDDQTPAEIVTVDKPSTAKHRKAKAIPWQTVEAYLLRQVQQRMRRMRKITPINEYRGPLSEMLVLLDTDITPYLPQAWADSTIRRRLKYPSDGLRRSTDPSVFMKLGLRMSKGGKEVDCYLEPHDPRRWLTTQALAADGRVSDVLINKWANRLKIGSLSKYDLRSPEQKADQAAIPLPKELEDISKGLHELEGLESQYGLSTEILISHGEGISVTSMEAMCGAAESRPMARTGSQIIILYPNRFGGCLHPHHETPCRAYGCGSGCDSQLTVKGHRPTNDQWRKEAGLTNRSILNQLQNLITAHNRGVADDQEMFNSHLLTLVGKGLDAQAMTTALVEQFHEVKDQIRDLNFKRSLEKAFVASGMVKRLDDPNVASGALIKYHNPGRHGAPGHELAIEANFGSREEMARQSEIFYQQNPELAPSTLGLSDGAHLLAGDDGSGERDDDAA